MVRHIVMFQFKGNENEIAKVAGDFKAALDRLPDLIPELISIEVGINANPAEQWHLVLTATVADMAAVHAYAVHPAHVAATKIIAEHKLARACVDYII